MMDERRRFLIQVIQFNRFTLRGYFGESFADKWGFFVDRNMSTEIHSYLDWVEYPMGDHELEGHTNWVMCAEVTQDGCYLFTGSEDGMIIKWNLRTNEVMTQFPAHSGRIMSLAHLPGILISGGSDGLIKMWNDNDYSLMHTMDEHKRGVDSLCLSKRGTILISGSKDRTCRLWSVKNGECLRVLEGHSKWVQSVLFAGDMIISGSLDQSIKIWESTDVSKESQSIVMDGPVTCLSLNCDSSILACCHFGKFSVFKWPSMEVISTVLKKVYRCCFHPSFPFILALNDDQDYSIQIYRTDTSKFTLNFTGHTRNVNSLQFSPDGYRLISVSDDQTVRVWDVSDLY